jgi:hypothetical protein
MAIGTIECDSVSEHLPPRTRTAPSARQERIARSLLLTALFALPGLIAIHQFNIADPDIWWHMRCAQWILTHHTVPRTDPFSAIGATRPWAAYSWLFELIVHRLYTLYGMLGITAYTAGMVTVIGVVTYRLMRSLQPDFTLSVLLTVLAMIGMSRLYTPRPWLFTIVFFALELEILFRVRRTGRYALLLWLAPIYALWANIHIQFVNGAMVVAIAALEAAALHWRSPRSALRAAAPWLGATALSVAATLANPYGWGLLRVIHEYSAQSRESLALSLVNELQPIPFRGMEDYLLLALLVGAVALIARSRRVQLFEILLLAFTAALAFRSQRDIWMMSLVAAAIIATHLPTRAEKQPIVIPAFVAPLIALAVGCLLLTGARLMHVTNASLENALVENMPVKAVDYIHQQRYSGPLFNDFNWGGYLIWSLPTPVSMDGRTNLYGDEALRRSVGTWTGAPDWASDPELAHAGLVIAPRTSALAQLLRTDNRFTRVYEDKLALVFINPSRQPKPLTTATSVRPLFAMQP